MENNKRVNFSFNNKSLLVICHIISFGTNLTLFLIFFLTEYNYKYCGLFLHFFLMILGISSILFLLKKGKNIIINLKNYKSIANSFRFFIYISILFYFSFLIYMYIYKYDIDIFCFFAICVGLWGIFHWILIIVNKSFIEITLKIKKYNSKAKKEKFIF